MKLTLNDVAIACGSNEQRIFDVAHWLGLPVRTTDTWYTVAHSIANELNRNDGFYPPAERLEMIVGLIGERPRKVKGVYGISYFDTAA